MVLRCLPSLGSFPCQGWGRALGLRALMAQDLVGALSCSSAGAEDSIQGKATLGPH